MSTLFDLSSPLSDDIRYMHVKRKCEKPKETLFLTLDSISLHASLLQQQVHAANALSHYYIQSFHTDLPAEIRQ